MLVLREEDVEALLAPGDAIAIVQESLLRGAGRSSSLSAVGLDGGTLATGAASDRERGLAGARTVASHGAEGSRAALVLAAADRPELLAVVEARRLGELRAAATCAVAARVLARPGASSLGLIGCGRLALAQLECMRVAVPSLTSAVAFCRDEGRRLEFCEEHGIDRGEYGRDAAEQDIVVTATTSRDPVLRGEWLRAGAFVCAAGAVSPRSRELDNVVLERASFVCADSVELARELAGDLIEPVERGVLDWLEVHELAESLVDGRHARQSPADVVVLKLVGPASLDLPLAALAVERAGERGVGLEL